VGLLHEVRCDRCDFRQELAERARVYVVAGSSPLGIVTALAWCAGCARVVEAEFFESTGALTRELHHLEHPHPEVDTFADLLGVEPADEARAVKERLAWRVGRESGPKCLECGGEALEFLTALSGEGEAPLGRLSTKHPGCGGALTAGVVGHAEEGAAERYDPEGKKLT
jgi:hypothetical protein